MQSGHRVPALRIAVGVALATSFSLPGVTFGDAVVYHSPADDGERATRALRLAPGRSADLFLYVDAGPQASAAADVCQDGAGDELCGWDVRIASEGEVELSQFTPDAGANIRHRLGEGGLRVHGLDVTRPTPGPKRIGVLQVKATGESTVTVSGVKAVGAALQLVPVTGGTLAVPEPAAALLGLWAVASLAGLYACCTRAQRGSGRRRRAGMAGVKGAWSRAAARGLRVLAAGVLAFATTASGPAGAATMQSVGPGSAVLRIDYEATFDSLSTSGVDLSDYVEDGIAVQAPDVSFPLQVTGGAGFGFYPNGGLDEGVPITVRLASGRLMRGVEVLIDDGFTSLPVGTPTFFWEAYRQGGLTGSGSLGYDPDEINLLGFSDPEGFDELRLRVSKPGFAFNALALDDLLVEHVPEPAAGLLANAALLALAGLRCRRAARLASSRS